MVCYTCINQQVKYPLFILDGKNLFGFLVLLDFDTLAMGLKCRTEISLLLYALYMHFLYIIISNIFVHLHFDIDLLYKHNYKICAGGIMLAFYFE